MLTLKLLIIPWSIGCKWEVVLGGRYLIVIFVSSNGWDKSSNSWRDFFDLDTARFFPFLFLAACDDSAAEVSSEL